VKCILHVAGIKVSTAKVAECYHQLILIAAASCHNISNKRPNYTDNLIKCYHFGTGSLSGFCYGQKSVIFIH